jgi:hypothetical protein
MDENPILYSPLSPQNMRKAPSQADSPQIDFEPLPIYKIPCQPAGLLEHWIEPTFQVGSILMGYASLPAAIKKLVDENFELHEMGEY